MTPPKAANIATGSLSTHVLDTARGRPAAGVPLRLEHQGDDGSWRTLGEATTDADGRSRDLLPSGTGLGRGAYRLSFDTGAYFRAEGTEAFYPEVTVHFLVREATQHHHVPLLLSPYGYATYRGS